MSIQPLQRLQFDDPKMQLLQDNISKAINASTGQPFANGSLLKDVQITTAGKRVDHKLGRVPTGYLILKMNADARVWFTAIDDKSITLDASATVTVSLWVF